MEDPSWKMLKLSLERPYKDDNSEPIPVLQDIAADGQYIYEPYVAGSNLGRADSLFLQQGNIITATRRETAPYICRERRRIF